MDSSWASWGWDLLLYGQATSVAVLVTFMLAYIVHAVIIIRKQNHRHHDFQIKYKKRFGKHITLTGREDTFLKNVIFPEDMTVGWDSICVPKEIVAQLQCQVIAPLKSIAGNSAQKTLPWQALPPKGILFSGSPGTGKSLLARTLAKETNCTYIHIRSTEIFNMYVGESEEIVKGLFSLAKKMEPTMIFIDEIDSIFSNRNDRDSNNTINSIKGTFLTFWDGLAIGKGGDGPGPIIIVVGATSRHQNVDPNFLRRLDLNMAISLPTLVDRSLILDIHLKGVKRDRELNTTKLAAMTNGFSGSDLKEVVHHAASICSNEIREKMMRQHEETMKKEEEKETQQNLGTPSKMELDRVGNNNDVTTDLKTNVSDAAAVLCSTISASTATLAHNSVGIPSDSRNLNIDAEDQDQNKLDELLKSEITITMAQMIKSIDYSKQSRSKSGGGAGVLDEYEVALAGNLIQSNDLDVTWKNIAGLNDVIRELKKHVIIPLAATVHRKTINSHLVTCPKGILFHGPPGSGKTLLAKALAYHSRCAFINVDVSTLQNKYYGDSQKLTSALFRLAEKYQPSIIFIDEIDAFLRQKQTQDHEITATIKAQFLSLWDGILSDPNKIVIVMGASNHPEDIDPAVMRRLTKKFKISLPCEESRERILKLILEKENNVAPTVNLKTLARLTEGFSPSELKDMACTAAVNSLKATMNLREDALASADSLISLELYALDSCRSLAGAWSIMDGNFGGVLTVKEITMDKFMDAIDIIKKDKRKTPAYEFGTSIYS